MHLRVGEEERDQDDVALEIGEAQRPLEFVEPKLDPIPINVAMRETSPFDVNLPDQQFGEAAAARDRVPDRAEDLLVFIVPVETASSRTDLLEHLNLPRRKSAANQRGGLRRRHQGGDREKEILLGHLPDMVGDGVAHEPQNLRLREVSGSSAIG